MPKIPLWVFIVIALLYFSAARIDTMDIDASQYAEISREMMASGKYLQLYDHGLEYLDKPPFLFWVSAASMKVFGVNNFGYKLPSILFALWAIFATYKLGKRLYGEATGRLSALVLACCQGMFLWTNDVRCDTILMSWTITAIWLIQEWVVSRKALYLLGGCAAAAFGMMTKGPIALMVPAFCFISDWALKRQWKNFFQLAYLPGLAVIAVLLVPMSIGLYQQFDLHPEKLVNGKTGVSGLRFFYWSQSFGRITGESPWKNGADFSFLMVNMLWSFLPWIFLFLPALALNTSQLIKQKLRLQPQQEWITTGGFLLTYISLGMSAYQLPHYILVVFPLASITTARFIYELTEEGKYVKALRVLRPVLTVFAVLTLIVALALSAWSFAAPAWIIAAWVAAFGVWLYVATNKKTVGKFVWVPVAAIVLANVFMSNYVYPSLLKYQAGSQAGRYVHDHGIPGDQFVYYHSEDPLNALSFYAQSAVMGVDSVADISRWRYVLTMEQGLDIINRKGMAYDILQQGPYFKVSEMTPLFINPRTRNKATKNYYLLKMK